MTLNNGGEDLDETPSMVVAINGGTIQMTSNNGGEDLDETPSMVVATNAPGASSSSAFDAGPSNTGGEDLDEKPSMVVADYGGIILEEGQQPNFHTFKEKDL
ncbi:PREDICTED: PRUPE_7G169000 [Prunus dulcis]|uniref:PREDICTED: PRUPE_7G169000 n=1 Tax=Prunus dulcis TaxID=3755 RepID=A0A5E4E3F3_PRUDU|nr:PREDICTED: PRUPE_7G169000 [Prunus dulcis]